MAVSVKVTRDGIHIFRVRGKLVAASVDDLKSKLDAAGDRVFAVVNLMGGRMADSVALGYLVRRHGILKRAGGALALCRLHTAVSKLLATADLNAHFAIYGEEGDAVDAFRTAFASRLPPPKKRGRKPKVKNAIQP